MAEINVSNLTYYYEGSYDNIFEHVSFQIDTNWKLGLIGRNGKGKSTFLKLLLGMYQYEGSIHTSVCFDYFPYEVSEEKMKWNTIDVIESINPEYELWKICRELDLLKTDSELLYRSFESLSHGERIKVMLSVLFSKDNYFLLIDEPTNHLDMETREVIKEYLNTKKGFILVSHDRDLLDSCIDHVLVLNRADITVEKGNFSSWWENKQRTDQFEKAQNEKLKQEIGKLEASARQSAAWADKVERTKIGFDPVKEHDRFIATRSYIGGKSKHMQKRRKNLERRQQNAMEEKKGLLKNIEEAEDLKLIPLSHYKEVYVHMKDISLDYGEKRIVQNFHMDIKRGDRILLQGKNGCGKSSLIKAILNMPNVEILNMAEVDDEQKEKRHIQGTIETAAGLKISYINQDTSGLKGTLGQYIEKIGVAEHLMKAVLRQMDFERTQFEKNMDHYSEGQKKKVLIAGSLLQQAHLYIWDEPLNYIDVFSRMQIEKLILTYKPTMLIVEHDRRFGEKVATKTICF